MKPRSQPAARRRFLLGAGAAVAGFGLPQHVRAEPAAEGWRVLRAGGVRSAGNAGEPRWGYDGTAPGPTLRLKRGEELRLRLVNDLAEPTAIHWHGVRVPNAMDGVPLLTQQAVGPGTSFDYRFRPPDAGTFWYHAYSPGQIDRGLHGALVVEEGEPVKVDRDIVLVLAMPAEAGGSPVLVNGSLRPDIPVKTGERVRLRLINATAARGLSLKLEGHIPWVMAIDGQPAEPFVARDSRLGLGPGSRVDLFVDMMRDAETVAPILAGLRDEQPIARLVYQSGGRARPPSQSPPLPLPPNPLPARIDLKSALRVELALADGKPLEAAGAPLFTVKRGRAVTLALRNTTGRPQIAHVHGHSCRLLDRLDDGWKPYWLDTLVAGAEIERIAFVADNPGKWMIAWRTLERPETAAATWFAVS